MIASVATAQPTAAPAQHPVDAAANAQPLDGATTMPATAPEVAVVPADLTTPRGALKVLTTAMDAGDVAAANSVLLAEKPEHRAWADSMLEFAKATAAVKDASVAKFGAEGAKAIVGDTAMATAAELAAIDRFTEELDGDKAIVRPGNPAELPIQFVKVDGAWRIPMAAMVGDAPVAELQETAGRMSRQVKAMDGFIKDMQADKFASSTDAAQALQLRLVQAVFGEAAAPATAPATQPSPG